MEAKKMKTFFKIFGLLVFTVILTGCEQDADNQASVAQKCLNEIGPNGGPSDAQNCLNIVGNSTDPRVLRVKCALKFIYYGISKNTLITAFKSLVSNPATGSPMINLANQIAAPSIGAADDMVATCESSGSIALTMIANASKLGYLAQTAAGSSAIGAVVAALPGMNAAEVGEIAASIASTYCAGGKQDEVCNTISSSGCDLSDAVCLGTYWKNTCLAQTTCH